LDERGIPALAEERLEIARNIVEAAEKIGIPKENILIDCLVVTASAQQELVAETLKAVRLVKENLGVKTVLGVSNVSFGLPNRPLINKTMLAMALMQGLDAPIMNPADAGMVETIKAYRVLAGNDKDSEEYTECYLDEKTNAADSAQKVKTHENGDLMKAIINGLKDEATLAASNSLKTMTALEIIEEHIVPALNEVGRRYENQSIYLPQLIKSAEAAKKAFAQLQTELLKDHSEYNLNKTKIALATVYGDIHDIGKNIVKVIMENYNFEIIDLGKDVPSEKIIEAVKKHNLRIVGLSALMTTTVNSMKEIITELKKECPFVKIIVGGAVLTEELACYV
jgi:5-methyltetrahydrofolate--homocysteine methyltransferase